MLFLNGQGGRKAGLTTTETTPLAVDARAELIQALFTIGLKAANAGA